MCLCLVIWCKLMINTWVSVVTGYIFIVPCVIPVYVQTTNHYRVSDLSIPPPAQVTFNGGQYKLASTHVAAGGEVKETICTCGLLSLWSGAKPRRNRIHKQQHNLTRFCTECLEQVTCTYLSRRDGRLYKIIDYNWYLYSCATTLAQWSRIQVTTNIYIVIL